MKQAYRFTASWCQPCKTLAKTLEKIETTTPIVVYDIDENADMAKKYNIRGVPTLVMVEGDQEVKRLVGVKPEQELKQWLNGE
jgi:thioredoxin 1